MSDFPSQPKTARWKPEAADIFGVATGGLGLCFGAYLIAGPPGIICACSFLIFNFAIACDIRRAALEAKHD